jgi:sec-independent protein translocase protein TatA
MFGNLGFPEMLLIFLVILLLFGAKKLPEIAQGLGKGIREFKKAMKETSDEVKGSISGEIPPPRHDEPPKRDDAGQPH